MIRIESQEDLAKVVREVRKEQGLTQKALAEACWMSLYYLARIERSQYPSFQDVLDVLAYLRIPLFVERPEPYFIREVKDSEGDSKKQSKIPEGWRLIE